MCVSSPYPIEFSVGLSVAPFFLCSLPSLLIVVLLYISVHLYQSNWLVTIPPEGYTKYKLQKKKKEARWVKLSSSALHVSLSLSVCLSALSFFLSFFLPSFLVLPLRHILFILPLSIVHPYAHIFFFHPLTCNTHQPTVCLLFLLSLGFLLLLHKTA